VLSAGLPRKCYLRWPRCSPADNGCLVRLQLSRYIIGASLDVAEDALEGPGQAQIVVGISVVRDINAKPARQLTKVIVCRMHQTLHYTSTYMCVSRKGACSVRALVGRSDLVSATWRPARPCPQHSTSHNLPCYSIAAINAHHYHHSYRRHGGSPCCHAVSNSAPRPPPRDRLMADIAIIPSESPVQLHVIVPHRQHRVALSS
jgi:hypothetical protein